MTDWRDYPMNRAPRCSATSKRTGKPCKAPAKRGWRVCHYHGAGGGSKSGPSANRWKHGMRSGQAALERRSVRHLINDATQLAAEIRQP